MRRSTTRSLVSYMTQFTVAKQESCLKHWRHDPFPRLPNSRTFAEEAAHDAFKRTTLVHRIYEHIKIDIM